MNNAQLILQDSGNAEYYTPSEIIEAARRTMGRIDLDPASCDVANQTVKATWIHTESFSGLEWGWFGNVWLNHPFSRKGNADWINKLVSEYESGRVTMACCITFASTSERWFQPLMKYPQCYLAKRVNYLDISGNVVRGCTKGSVVTYLGSNIERFCAEFRGIGNIMIPISMVASLSVQERE